MQRVVDVLGDGGQARGPNGKVIAAPSSLSSRRPPRRRNWMTAPGSQGIRRGDKTAAEGQEKSHGSPGVSVERDANARVATVDSKDERENLVVRATAPYDHHVGLFIQRRALPIYQGARRPAPMPVRAHSRNSGGRDANGSSGTSSSDDDSMLSAHDASILSCQSESAMSSRVRGRHADKTKLALPHQDMDEGEESHGRHIEYTKRASTLDKKASSKVGLSYKLAAKAIQKVIAPKKKFDQPKVLIDHRFQYLAYLLAFIWYMVRPLLFTHYLLVICSSLLSIYSLFSQYVLNIYSILLT